MQCDYLGCVATYLHVCDIHKLIGKDVVMYDLEHFDI